MKSNALKTYVRLIIEEESSPTTNGATFGELKKALKLYADSKGREEKIKSKKKIGKIAAKIALDFIPFAGAISNTTELVGALMNIKDEDRPKGFLTNFDLDDYTSKIVDNKIEALFLKHILKVINDKDENELIKDFDMTDELNRFLQNNFSGRGVEGYK